MPGRPPGIGRHGAGSWRDATGEVFMGLLIWRFLALLITALSLGLSFAHLLEAPPRLTVWPPELWREATVFPGQFRLFGLLGGPIDIGAALVLAVLAYLTRGNGLGFRLALTGAALFAASLVVWLVWVAPANSVMAGWRPGPVPGDFHAIRDRWETGHMAMAGIKLAGFATVILSVLLSPAPPPERAS